MSICTQNLVEIDTEMAEIHYLYISKMAAVGHLGIVFPSIWTSHDVNLSGLHFPCQWRNDPV